MILEKFYKELETITAWNSPHQLSPIEGKIDKESEDKIKTERKVLLFSLRNGELCPEISAVDSQGEINSYPDLNRFTDTERTYLENRLQTVHNIWMKSKYSHVLWCITKNNQYAKVAIDSYLKIVDVLINDPDAKQKYKVHTFVITLLFIAKHSKQEVQLIKETVFRLIKSNMLPTFVKSQILEIVIDSSLFQAKELEFILEYINGWIEIRGKENYGLNQSILQSAIKLSEKLQNSPKFYYQLLAENEDLLLNQHLDEKDFLRCKLMGDKAIYYKKAGDVAKYEDCLKECAHLKTTFELECFGHKLPEQVFSKLEEYLRRRVKTISEMPTEDLLAYFARSEDFLIRDQVSDNNILNLFSVIAFDINSNSKQLSTEEAREKYNFTNYRMIYSSFIVPLISRVFTVGILNGKIGYHSVFSFLQENSWYGQRSYRGINEENTDEKFEWLSLLAPGLHDYFSQVEWSVMMDKNHIPNYILCIDSLTTKFEGALRDFVRLQGGNITREKKGKLQEKLLEELLHNEIIIKLFSKEDILLFTYVFTKKGWNLRNNVAHCFYSYNSYTFEKATLVVICILRLGKYISTNKKNDI